MKLSQFVLRYHVERRRAATLLGLYQRTAFTLLDVLAFGQADDWIGFVFYVSALVVTSLHGKQTTNTIIEYGTDSSACSAGRGRFTFDSYNGKRCELYRNEIYNKYGVKC